MKPVKLAFLALAAVGGLSACVDQDAPSSPLASTTASLAVAPSNGQHLVLFKGNSLPADLSAKVAALGGKVVYTHAKSGFALVSGLTGSGAAALSTRSDVASVTPDAVVGLDAQHAVSATLDEVSATSQAQPATALRYSFQWNMRAIGANQAWAAGKLGSPDVTVAILDSGLDYNIRDLVGLVDLSRSASFVPSDVDTLAKYFPTFVGSHPIQDLNGHGTNVATQVSSKAFALAGVTSKTTLMGVKVLGATGDGGFGGILAGILHAADNGADVANMSLGASFSKALGNGGYAGYINRIVNYATQQGMLIVVSAGNESTDLDHDGNGFKAFCSAANVVCVSATGQVTPTGSPAVPAFYTNFGRSAITVAAPGGNAAVPLKPIPGWAWGTSIGSFVWSFCSRTTLDSDTLGVITGPRPGCIGGGSLTGMIGTSQAAPHVAGVAALLIAEGAKGNPAQVKNAIIKAADDLGQPGADPFYGKGFINVPRALGLE